MNEMGNVNLQRLANRSEPLQAQLRLSKQLNSSGGQALNYDGLAKTNKMAK